MLLKRQEYRERTKNALVFRPVLEKPKGKRKCVNYNLDSDRSIASEPGGNRSPRPSKSNNSRKR